MRGHAIVVILFSRRACPPCFPGNAACQHGELARFSAGCFFC